MFTPRRILYILVMLNILALYSLFFSQGGLVRKWERAETLSALEVQNQTQLANNNRLRAELQSLKTGKGAIEERARQDLNMIRPGEILFRVQRPQKTLPGNEIDVDILTDPMLRATPEVEGAQPIL